MSTETQIPALFNPSRDGQDNSVNRTLYGQVLRFPTLPPAHRIFEGVTVFDQETKDFYECQHIVTGTEDYYEWVAVTFGAARVFLIPVGKLTELDISTLSNDNAETFLDHTGLEVTDKSFIEHVAGTINELIYGFFRYHRYFTYLGYQAVPVGTPFQGGVEYYTFQQNDLIDIFIDASKGDAERHKVYVGEVKKLDTIPTGTVEDQYTYFTKLSSDPNMTDCATVLNQIITLLNKHAADIDAVPIPEQWTTTDYRKLVKALNEVVEEVDPFAVPWQVVINRIWHLEQKVGNGIFQPNDDIAPVDFAGVWYAKSHDHAWQNVPAEVQDALEYATICQIDDTIFKLLSSMDDIIGNLIVFLSAEGNKYGQDFPTLVAYLEWAVSKIPRLERKVDVILEGIRQLRRSLGDLGFVVATDTEFLEGVSYYVWYDDNAMMEKLLIAGETSSTPTEEGEGYQHDPDGDYQVGDNIAEWCSQHGDVTVYQFFGESTAEYLIKQNAYNIAVNRENIDLLKAIVGTTFTITSDATFVINKSYFKMTRDGYVYLRPGSSTEVSGGTADYVPGTTAISSMPFKVYERDRSWGEKFYIETLSIPVVIDGVEQTLYHCEVEPDFQEFDDDTPVTEPDYGCKKNTTFVPFLTEDFIKDDLSTKTYQEVYEEFGPIFVLAKPKVLTEIVEMNNREIAALNRRHSTRITWIEKTMNLRPNRLKELTGVEGVTAELDTWHVDGYKKVVLPCSSRWKYFGAYRHYYRKVVDGDADYTTHFIRKWKVTTDEFFKEGKVYYKPSRIPPYNEPDEDHWVPLRPGTEAQVESGDADYVVGSQVPHIDPEAITVTDVVNNPNICDDIIVEIQDTYYDHKPFLFIELIQGTPEEVAAGTADYCLPGYSLTTDVTFQTGKVYYHRNAAGQFMKASGGTYQQFQAGNCTYWIDTAYPSSSYLMDEGKVFYSIDLRGIKGYGLLIKDLDYTVGSNVSQSPRVYESTSMDISAFDGSVYEIVNLSYVPASGKFSAGKVYYKLVQKEVEGSDEPVDTFERLTQGTLREFNAGECDYWVNEAVVTSDTKYQNNKNYYILDDQGLAGFYKLRPDYDYNYGDTVTGEIYEYGSMTIPAGEFYEKTNGTKINRWSNVWVRDRRWKEYNTHRGLIDRNTDDLIAHQLLFGQFKDWTEGQIGAIKDFILYLMLATLEIVTQENSTFSILHNTTAKLITILNAIAKLENNLRFKHADGVYDGAYSYYRAIAFDVTHDETFQPGKTYFVEDYDRTTDTMFEDGRDYYRLTGTTYVKLIPSVNYLIGQAISDMRFKVYTTTYREAIVNRYAQIPTGPDERKYYEPSDFRKLDPNTEINIGLEVSPRTYTLDLVMPTVENYTITEIKDAVNRVIRDHMCDPAIPLYTALPTDQPIEAHMTYYRYVDEEWEKIQPTVDDPDMIGQLMKEYDPEHVWYIKTDQEIPDQGYTMTWIRIMMNEMIRFHNKGAEKFNNAFANFIANKNQDEADAEPDE